MREPKIGDSVKYVPGQEHALQKDPTTGEYPWVMGKKTHQGRVDELSGGKLDLVLQAIRVHPDRQRAVKDLVYLRPNSVWEAKIAAVNEDGTLNLDVKTNRGGVTLHQNNVKIDTSKVAPNTCYYDE